MTKKELIKKMEGLPDDADLSFALLHENKQGAWVWKLLNPALGKQDDPADVIALVTTPITRDTLQGLSRIK